MVLLGLRNLFRAKTRLAVAVLLLALPAFLLLVLQAILTAVETHTETLKRNVDNSLQLRARGSMGHVNMQGNETILPQSALDTAIRIPGVAAVEQYLLAMTPTEGHNFAMIVGVNPGETRRLESHGEAGNPRIVAGRDLTAADRGQRVAVIGQGVARWARITSDNLASATLTLDLKRTHPVIFALERPPATLRIVGVYASGYVFGDMQLFVPIDTFREIYGVPEGISWLFVRAVSADRLPEVEAALRRELGEAADIIAPIAAAEFERTTTRAVRRFSAIGSALAAALMVIVVFFVTLINVRERTREIGTLMALGASGAGVAASFLAEALALAALGATAGAAVFAVAGSLVPGQLFGVAVSPFLPAQYKDALRGALAPAAGLGPSGAGWFLLATAFAACAGSAWGLRQVVKLSPVEAIRHE
ncbi:MAG: ABC transporter permease [Betaproteobacteria bacterium]|nr:ABC transporter permease [Betaproteobacteria bacterium]